MNARALTAGQMLNDALQGPRRASRPTTSDPCWLTYYIGGALITAQRCRNVNQAKNTAPEVGQWIPYCYGWHSADCRTLILRDAAMGRKDLDQIEAEWIAERNA